ncbi:uncharacterized protein LOC110010603 [Jatropha curcas]|uniref:uncharacterized protein LOC110010603 n=1 Tax=Jatropha curcas TaxID=180498 RepID=UPI0009D6BCB5|nr:uncharacterized protein LOC110010603 [Jatropha curcas]
MADDSVPVPDKQLCLYEVDLSRLFLDEDLNQKLSLSLASISNDLLNESYLKKSVSKDPRRCLYVLIDPIESWKARGGPTVYCAIQVYLEGEIPDYPEEDENVGNFISYILSRYPQFEQKNLVGAHILHLFQILDASEDGYGWTALDTLTRFYDGQATMNNTEQGPLINPRKKWTKLHYAVICSDLTVNAVSRLEGLNFFVIFAGTLMKPGPKDTFGEMQIWMFKKLHDYESEVSDGRFAVNVLAEQSFFAFVRQLSRELTYLDQSLVRRILKSFHDLIPPKNMRCLYRMWTRGKEQERVEEFIKVPEKPENLQPIRHLLEDLAQRYLTREQPIKLSQDEEDLLINFLQNRPNMPLDNDARSKLSKICEKAAELYKTYDGKVVEDPYGRNQIKELTKNEKVVVGVIKDGKDVPADDPDVIKKNKRDVEDDDDLNANKKPKSEAGSSAGTS